MNAIALGGVFGIGRTPVTRGLGSEIVNFTSAAGTRGIDVVNAFSAVGSTPTLSSVGATSGLSAVGVVNKLGSSRG